MPKQSKLYRKQMETFSRDTYYSLAQAVEIIKAMPHAKFNETVELAFRLGIDPRQTDQNVRGAIPLPKGTGKDVRVAVIAAESAADAAKAAGADIVGLNDLIADIKAGKMDFDVLITVPDAMPQVRTLGRVLGPRGLMPNPKTGTVTDDVASAVKEAKAGRVEYRNDKGGCVQVPVGKVAFTVEDIVENAVTVIKAILRAKPAAASGVYMQACTLSSTMSPGIRLDIKEHMKVNA